MKIIFILIAAIILLMPYFINFDKFLDCNFRSDYKCELVHGAGVVIPPLAFVTVWVDSDKD